jgi:RND family efflux transporter MFP subunit
MAVAAAGGPAVGCARPAPPPAAPPPPAVAVVRPVSHKVQAYNEYNGYLDAVETVEVRARVKGFLTGIAFKEGDEVKAGDPLYTIDPREYAAAVAKSRADIAKAAADMANARALIKNAEADLARFNRSGQAVSQSELDKATATLDSNKAQLDVATANKAAAEAALQSAELELGYTDIRAPIAGRISRTLVTRGNLVGQMEATLLTTIVSLDPLYVYFDAPEADLVSYQRQLQGVSPGAAGGLPVAVGVATEEGYPHAGVIDFRENRVDTGTGTVRVRGRVPNPVVPPGNVRVLYPGLFARVRVPDGPPRDLLVVPEDALMTGQEGRYVYVVDEKNVVHKRTVVVRPQVVWRAAEPDAPNPPPGWVMANTAPPPATPPAAGTPPAPTSVPARSVVAIDRGLKPGDAVIVNGLQKARPEAPVEPEVWELRPPAAR